MAQIDDILGKYTDTVNGSVHGVTFIAVDRSGNDIYRKSFGNRNVDPRNSKPLTPDTVTWMASQSKLTTSVAVMQIVERGLIGLDDDVRDVVPRLRELKVITGFEDEIDATQSTPNANTNEVNSIQSSSSSLERQLKGRPILEDLNGPITLRQLVTHSSGFCYDTRHPLLIKYSAWAGRQDNMFSGTMDGLFHPLVFQPGTSWEYGPGLDWAAHVVEKLTGMEYDTYQQKHIWQPLGATDTTFFPAKRGLRPEDLQETGHRVERQEDAPQGLKVAPSPWKFECRDALGGAGLFSTASDYSKLLSALLADGGPLLSKASVDELFSPQLGSASMKALREWLISTSPESAKSWLWTDSPSEWQEIMEIKHCLCGLVNTEDVKGRRRKHTVSWNGLPNLLWYIDRESGIAATIFTQIVPTDDGSIREMSRELEEALYRMIR